jgi:hypothetical protein
MRKLSPLSLSIVLGCNCDRRCPWTVIPGPVPDHNHYSPVDTPRQQLRAGLYRTDELRRFRSVSGTERQRERGDQVPADFWW